MARNENTRPRRPGPVGNLNEDELANAPEVDVTAHPPTRQDDDPEALRRGIAGANRREVAHTEPLEEEDAGAVPGENRGGVEPGGEGERRGEKELERGTE